MFGKNSVPLRFKAFGIVVASKNLSFARSIAYAFLALCKKGDTYFTLPKEKAIQDTPYEQKTPQQGVVTIDQSLTYDNNVMPNDLVHHFIEKASYHAKVKHCLCRTKMKCENHPRDFGCLILGDGVSDVAERVAEQLTKEEAHEYARTVRQNGLIHCVGRAFPDVLALRLGKKLNEPHKKFMTICNCCDCCCLFRVYPKASDSVKQLLNRLPGLAVSTGENCVECGTCAGTCIFGAIKYENGKSVRTKDCLGCGRCVETCPNNALSITYNDDGIAEAIDELERVVDVS